MKGFRTFKNYVTKTIFDPDTQTFEERRIDQEDFEETPRNIPQAIGGLSFMLVGLQRPIKTPQRKTQK